MIIDVSFYPTFYNAEKIDNYKDLMTEMTQVDPDIYTKLNIYTEKHHLIPSFEVISGSLEFDLPVSLHFLAHYLRAREAKTEFEQVGNYTIAYNIFMNPKNKDVKQVQGFFYNKIKECEDFVVKWFRAPTYEQQFGALRAQIIKDKISDTMSNLQREVIENRNRSIKLYAKNRPALHNRAIAEGRTKKITDELTGQIYDNIETAAFMTDVSVSSIRKACLGVREKKGFKFRYLRKDLYDLMG